MSKKCHQWTEDQESKLIEEVEACGPLFKHFKNQSEAYTKLDAWDAVAGRMLPEVVVTGAACKRRFDKLVAAKSNLPTGWDDLEEMVDKYERDLAETTFDAVSEILGNQDALFEGVIEIKNIMTDLKKMWCE